MSRLLRVPAASVQPNQVAVATVVRRTGTAAGPIGSFCYVCVFSTRICSPGRPGLAVAALKPSDRRVGCREHHPPCGAPLRALGRFGLSGLDAHESGVYLVHVAHFNDGVTDAADVVATPPQIIAAHYGKTLELMWTRGAFHPNETLPGNDKKKKKTTEGREQ